MKVLFGVVLVLILVFLFWIFIKKENFDPYVGKQVPYLINSGASFDFPNQFGEITDPYFCKQYNSENMLWDQLNELSLTTPL